MDDNKVLLASYGGKAPDKNYDLENKLLYNIGTGAFSSIFKNFPKQIVFKTNDGPVDEKSPYRYLYKYEVVPSEVVEALGRKTLIAKWNVTIGSTLPKQAEEYYLCLLYTSRCV